MSNEKYIVPCENSDTIDIQKLYPIIGNDTGLNQDDIFEAIYEEDGNGSMVYVDCATCVEIVKEEGYYESQKKVYQWFYDRMNAGELPKEFYIHVWW